MQVQIHPVIIKGSITAPPSKSVMQRACAAALLRNGITRIVNYGTSEDDKSALSIIQQLGATVHIEDDQCLTVTSDGTVKPFPGAVLNCGESGLAFRMFAPIAALADVEIAIAVRGSLAKRPSHFINEILLQLGVELLSKPGEIPLRIKGPLKPKNITVDGSLTSQFITGLLFAYAAAKGGEVAIETLSLKSKPYVDLTLQVMEDFKMNVPGNLNYETFIFKQSDAISAYKNELKYTVEGDWSNAAFLLVAGAIAGNVTVKGLDVFTTQADKKVLEALQDCGCRLSIQSEQIEVSHQPLKAFHFDATDCPDLFPPLAALAACCKGTSVIEGVHRLAHKESNRGEIIQQEFKKMGIEIDLQDDNMIIKGGTGITGAAVDSHNDHRIAMACAVLALKASEPVTINHAEAVDKSYPGFYNDIQKLCGEQSVVELS
jgi:3-phosphoshikimate 1-carboxyvinyltransferase